MGFSDRKIKALMVTYYSVLIIFYMSIALIAIKALPLLGEEHIPEQAFFVFMKTYIPNNVSWLIPLLIFGVFAATVESQLNWAGSLLDSVISDKWKQRSWAPYLMMGIVAAAAIGCTLVFDRILFVINFILGISAGVSLIFILRWFTPRINAQVQLSAMVGAVIYTFLVKMAGKVWFPELSDIDQQLYLMITVTVLVLGTAAVVSAITYTEKDKEAYRTFRQSVHFPSPVVPLLMKAALVGIDITLVGFGLFRMMAG